MKIAVLGGAGTIGSGVIKELVAEKEIERVYACEIKARLDKAEELAKELGPKVSATTVDVRDTDNLAKVIKGVDVVINCAGPFYKLAVPVIKTAAKIGVNYVDIMDDPDSMIMVLDDTELFRAAKDSGTTIIVGLGSTPGLSNMLAKYGASKLDTVDRIDVSWVFTSVSGTGAGGAVSEHMLHVMNKGWTFRDGKLVETEPLVDGREIQDFVELGKLEVYDIGHPEPIMLPRYIKGVKNVTCKTGMLPYEMFHMYQVFSRLGFFGLTQEELKGAAVSPREFVKQHLANVPMETMVKLFKLDELAPVFELRVAVAGQKDSGKTTYIYGFADVYHESETYIPPSLAALLIGRKEIKGRGVFAPEGCIEPESFLRKVVEKGVPLYEAVHGSRALFKP